MKIWAGISGTAHVRYNYTTNTFIIQTGFYINNIKLRGNVIPFGGRKYTALEGKKIRFLSLLLPTLYMIFYFFI